MDPSPSNDSSSAPPRPWAAVVPIAVLATLLGLIASGQHNISMRMTGGPTTLGHALAMGMPYWYLWAVMIPIIATILDRFPIDRVRWVRWGAVHFGAAIGITLVHSILEIFTQQALGARHDSFQHLTLNSLGRAFWELPYNLLAYTAVLGLILAAQYYEGFRTREREASLLAAELARSQVHALRMQLNPHFLFNSMNSITMLVRRGESAKAVGMMVGLSGLLRALLDESQPHEVALRDELAFMKRYLAIEEVRFQDRLRVTVDVDEVALEGFVPNLLLQPLVENAIRHGISRRATAGRIEIAAHVRNDQLELSVTDDGPGLTPGGSDSPSPEGIGLKNVRARLRQLYGDAQRFMMMPAPGGGAMAAVSLPYHRQPLTGGVGPT